MNLRPLTLIGIVISMVTGIALGITGYRAWLDLPAETEHARAFEEVLRHVQAHYVDEVDKDQLMSNALRGMLEDLDDYSLYLDNGAYSDLQAETTGQFGGIGIEIGLESGFFRVIAPIEATPAAAAGLRSGDRLVEIDHESLKGRKLIDVVKSLRGEPGSEVHLRILRDDEPREVTLTRAVIEISSIDARLLEPGYGYVRISQFQMETGPAFERAIASLTRQSGGILHGLVLDLRDNPGGVLQASVSVADALLDDGLIVSTKGRLPASRLSYRAVRGDLLQAAPVVVLINRGSASAAEIVAGALQDHGRATVMGSRSYGKGSVQSVVPLGADQAIKLTTAYYFTPSGRAINHTGIEPDLPRGAEAAETDTEMLTEALGVLKTESLHARL